jgi:hypothetical protein
MDLFGKRKPVMADMGETMKTKEKEVPDTLPEIKQPERQVITRDVTEQYEKDMALFRETFVTKEDAAAEILALHEKYAAVQAIQEQLNNVIAYLKAQQQPKL